VDESTDKSKIKYLACIVRTSVDFYVKDNFLCLLPIIDGSAISLHKEITEYFTLKNIPYKDNMIGFASDGANVMFGEKHSVCVLFSQEIPYLFKMKCICHSFHLCASYACEKLPRGVEDFARNVYNYIQNSPKRIGDYKIFQCFTSVEPHNLLHPAQTRWLSLLSVVRRLLEQLPALKLYFQSAVLVDRLLATQNILNKCMEPTTELYLELLSFVLPYFNDLNKEMQSEHFKIYLLYERIFTTYKSLLECFLRQECFELTNEEINETADQDSTLETKILNIDVENKLLHLPLEEMYLGGNIAGIIKVKKDILSQECLQQFWQKCLDFYLESAKQIRKRFPFEEKEQLKNLRFLNPQTLLDPNIKKTLPSIATSGLMFPGILYLFYSSSTFNFTII